MVAAEPPLAGAAAHAAQPADPRLRARRARAPASSSAPSAATRGVRRAGRPARARSSSTPASTPRWSAWRPTTTTCARALGRLVEQPRRRGRADAGRRAVVVLVLARALRGGQRRGCRPCSRSTQRPSRRRVRALRAGSHLAWWRGDYAQTDALQPRSWRRARRRIDDAWGLAWAPMGHGAVLMFPDPRRALALFEDSRRRFAAIGRDWEAAYAMQLDRRRALVRRRRGPRPAAPTRPPPTRSSASATARCSPRCAAAPG